MANKRKVKSLATKLVDLLCIHNFCYFPSYESWVEKGTEDSWRVVPYSYIKEISNLILVGLTREKVSPELTKEVLIQIERWMLNSEGELVRLETNKGKASRWYPLCLVESEENPTSPQVGDRATTKI
ncbi:MAG: hypothetical protein QNJ70_09555 [Xenococcaceae cyanobacterium MO_207.B15]|nr:hypothetical protein [Xenococcaceae cyanobacterium MO_207.B15]MDJ0745113.1 hypothetical protein [Xenococcaceae cyanobacterium MO_167.B27]